MLARSVFDWFRPYTGNPSSIGDGPPPQGSAIDCLWRARLSTSPGGVRECTTVTTPVGVGGDAGS